MAEWTKLTWQEAEERTSCRLDRRRSYFANAAGVVCVEEVFESKPCSGCHNTEDGYCTSGCEGKCRGMGCDECGYQGRVRQRWYMPVMAKDRPPHAAICWDPKVNITEREASACGI